MDRPSYESTLRRSELALPGLLGVVALIILLAVAAVRIPIDGNTIVAFLPFVVGGILLAIGFFAFTAFRVHRWTIEADGVRIDEQPKVALTGFRRSAVLAFPDIVALRRVQSGFDAQLEIVTRDGKRYRLAQAFRPGVNTGFRVPDPEGLEAFASSIRSSAIAAGHELPAMTEGLSFWSRPVGLGLLVIMFAFSLAIALLTGWALWDGLPMRPRMGEAAAIFLLLPVGAAYLLFKSLKRRRAVLAVQSRK